MKDKIIDKIEGFILQELNKICDDKTMKNEEKLEAYIIYKNIFLFLKDYEKNIQTLQKQIEKEKFEGRE